ncbi:SDR family oxidoreductase [Geomicrobium sp. JCM 19039]|uniref:SDR family oxidoreductase n=1 Tax=Geomicrobium sp. JCM 19039 TaxID=1460636 RepID=UPI00045F119D|nr:SDR family oxidoreductase [Geomicrobium sp. JCM 19039]GAK11121.1 alcohol dehydrogenase [Geomicrobium sp. JCM 19039]
MRHMNVIITGANSGIGKATAQEIGRRGAHVTIACRSITRGEEAKQQLLAEVPNGRFSVMYCDLNDLESVQQFAQAYQKKHTSLDRLINNAGVVTLQRETTAQGFEKMLGVNHLGHFLLTQSLLPMMVEADCARVINLSSGAYKWGAFDSQDPHLDHSFSVMKAYGRSKLANLWFTMRLAERLKHTRANTVAVHPGAVSTSLGVNRDTGFGKGVHQLLRPFFSTAEQGAETSVFLADTDDIVNGGYYYKMKRRPVKKALASDQREAERFWQWSKQMIENYT